MGAMGQLTLRMEALQQRGEQVVIISIIISISITINIIVVIITIIATMQLRGGRGETRLSRFPATSLSSPSNSSPSISPTSPGRLPHNDDDDYVDARC